MSASEEQESLSADPEEHDLDDPSEGDQDFTLLSGEGSEGDHYPVEEFDEDYDEGEAENKICDRVRVHV